jgi:16S rRNA (guanine(966)-N(2))-methyltransferase RsmD
MRIIAGKARGRILKTTKGTKTRPTQDRVKEALFNIITPFVPGAYGIDLFSGTGNLGLEALSRGAEHFVFVEKNSKNIKVIKENIKNCDFIDKAVVYKSDVYEYLSISKEKYDLILMDPPYGKDLVSKALEIISERGLVKRDGIIVIEHRANESIGVNTEFRFFKEKIYGDTGITILMGGE